MISFVHDNDTRITDLVRDGGNIQTDELLDSAVMISLFTRRLASADDALPDPLATNRAGWWADPYADAPGDLIGSRLWLLRRSKSSQRVLNLAKTYAEEALQWLVDDGIAQSVTVEVERQGETLAFRVEILRPSVTASRWSGTWQAHLEQL